MTETEIDVLDSKALDAAVAERVMGWRLFESSGETWATERRPGLNNSAYNVERQAPGDVLMFHGRRFGFFDPGWSPSSQWGAAGQVIEFMMLDGWGFECGIAEEPWLAIFAKGMRQAVAYADRGPLSESVCAAICRAALKAVSP